MLPDNRWYVKPKKVAVFLKNLLAKSQIPLKVLGVYDDIYISQRKIPKMGTRRKE